MRRVVLGRRMMVLVGMGHWIKMLLFQFMCQEFELKTRRECDLLIKWEKIVNFGED